MYKILIVDDHKDILDANRSFFREQGFEASTCTTGERALALLSEQAYDCILLDIMLPGMDGYSVCKEIRSSSGAPIIFVSCLDEVDDKIKGLMAGGDDYVSKPYDLRELHARVLSAIRRGYGGQESAGFRIDAERRAVILGSRIAILSRKEFALLSRLLENKGGVTGKNELMEFLWPDAQPDENRLQSLVRNVRKKLSFAEGHIGRISSVYATGYRLEGPDETGGST